MFRSKKGDIKIACEISITSTAAWEARNVTKCLQAGYSQVWVIAFPQRITRLTARIRETVPVIEQVKLKVFTLGDCFAELLKLAPQIDPKTGKPIKLAGQWLTVPEVAEFFQVAKSTIYRWKNEGRLPYRQVGRKILFDRDLILLIGRHNLTGKQRTSINLDKPVKIEKPKTKTEKQQIDRYRKMVDLD